MKPRITLAEFPLSDGSILELQEHDGRKSLSIHGQQICGPATRAAENELARLACAPFRPVRQPRIWCLGLGLGQTLETVAAELKQKRASIMVAEPMKGLVEWHRANLPEGVFASDPRVVWENNCDATALIRHHGSLHAILMHLDAAPSGPNRRPWLDHRGWLSAAYDALQPGGLLAVAASRQQSQLTRRLQRSGFEVAEFTVPAAPEARKSRLVPIWLARKGKVAG